jgi:hypothetical protein
MTTGPHPDRSGIIIAVLGGLAVAIAAVVVVLVISRGSGGSAATTTTQPTTTTSGTTSPVATTTTAGPGTTQPATTTGATPTTAPFAGDLDPKSAAAQGTPYGTLTGVRSAQREGFTRIVFDFGGTDGIPEYDVRYVLPPFRNVADQEVAVAGTAFLRVRVFPASRADLSLPEAPLTYTGPLRFDPGTVSAAEVVFVEDFEAQMIWVIGLDAQRPFAVGTLTNPPRLYVDIAD